MREILFRGKRLDNGEWVCGYYVELKYDGGKLGKCGFIYPCTKADYISVAVDPKTIEQYTGLTDKNGKKIFEGDIVERYERGITEPHNLYPTEKAKVGWNNAFTEFRANIIDLYHEEENLGEFIQGCEIEVIGNVHDHPELLEVR